MNKLVKNTTFYTIGNILPKIGSFLLIPIYTKYLDPSEYGIVYSLQVLVSVLTIAFTLSLPRAIYRLYYDYNSFEEKRIFISSIINAIFVISISVFLLTLIFNNVVSKIFISIDFFPYFLYILIYILFNSFETVPKALLQVEEKAKLFVFINVSQFLLKNGLIILFVAYFGKGAEGYLLGQMLSAIIIAPVLIYLIRNYVSISWHWSIIRSTLVFSLPMIPGMLSAWILNLSDRIFIERYFSTAEVGIYSLGYQIAGLALVFSGGIKSAFDPHFYKITNNYSYKEAKLLLSKELKYFNLFMLLIVFSIALFSKEVIMLFIDNKYLQAIKIVPIISLAYFISHFSGYLNLMIYQCKKSIVVMYITIAGAGINIGLNFLLIPVFGIFGAAWATVLSFLLVFILSEIVSRRYYHITLSYGFIGVLTLLGSIIIITLNYYLELNVILSLTLKLAILSIISAIMYFKYRDKLFLILRKKN